MGREGILFMERASMPMYERKGNGINGGDRM